MPMPSSTLDRMLLILVGAVLCSHQLCSKFLITLSDLHCILSTSAMQHACMHECGLRIRQQAAGWQGVCLFRRSKIECNAMLKLLCVQIVKCCHPSACHRRLQQ